MNEVQLIRLVSGEEILAKIENVEGGVKFETPHLIIPTQGKGIALMPWCPYSKIQEEGITVPTDKILFITNPHDELAKSACGILMNFKFHMSNLTLHRPLKMHHVELRT